MPGFGGSRGAWLGQDVAASRAFLLSFADALGIDSAVWIGHSIGAQTAIVRGLGLIQSVSQIENVLVTQNGTTPVLLKDVATVKIGNQPRLGIVGQGMHDDDIVVAWLYGEPIVCLATNVSK